MVPLLRELYARLEEETGLSTGFRQCGYIQLATSRAAERSCAGSRRSSGSVGMVRL